jgi:hypothetical protein
MSEEQISPAAPIAADEIPAANQTTAPATYSPESNSRPLLTLLAGAASAVVGAAIWAVITVAVKYQIGWMAIGVGFLVGLSVKAAGKGGSPRHATIAAVFALLGCALGNLLSMCGFFAQQESMSFWQVLGQMNPDFAIKLMQISFSPMDILFYGIAVYEAYKLSLKP